MTRYLLVVLVLSALVVPVSWFAREVDRRTFMPRGMTAKDRALADHARALGTQLERAEGTGDQETAERLQAERKRIWDEIRKRQPVP
jgi:hypothetical protein